MILEYETERKSDRELTCKTPCPAGRKYDDIPIMVSSGLCAWCESFVKDLSETQIECSYGENK